MRKTVRRAAPSRSISIPSPVSGWNARDSLAEMKPTDAVALVNFFPATTECVLRYGYSEHATGLPAQVETVMVYSGGSTEEMWAIADGKVYDATTAGAVGTAAVTGLTNSRWQYANFATSGGNFLYMANGYDDPYHYDGSTWANPTITGVTASNLNSPIVFKNRLFFIERNTLKAQYLPTQSIAGAANAVDMSAVAQLGGHLVAHCTWTIDAGTGVDDYYVAITSNGEVIVYQGTDPSDATKWALKGVWRIGSPVGERCMMKLAGDVIVVCQDGVVPLSAALQSSRVNPRVSLTDKIQWAVSQAVTSYGGNFGWELFYFPAENQLWLNVPVLENSSQEQYAMNTITRNWGQYQGWNANCFCLFRDQAYFGGNGVVCKAWDTNADNGSNISGYGLQAFSAYGAPGNQKRFTMMRPILRTTGTPSLLGSVNTDFDTTASAASLSFSPVTAATWDAATWDSGIWSGLSILQNWQGVSGIGYYAAPQLKASANGIEVRWVSTDLVFERGGIL